MTSVYQYIDRDGNVLYVGCTNNFKVRDAAHQSRTWYVNVHSIKLELFASRDEAATHELRVINAIRPVYNKNLTARACRVFANEDERTAYYVAKAEAVLRNGSNGRGMEESALWFINRHKALAKGATA